MKLLEPYLRLMAEKDASDVFLLTMAPPQMKIEGEIFQKRLVSPEAKEAMTAFMERRTPDFTKFS